MKEFPFGLFPSGESINVRKKQQSLVWYTFNSTIHPTNIELGATQNSTLPTSSLTNWRLAYNKIKEKGSSVNYIVLLTL